MKPLLPKPSDNPPKPRPDEDVWWVQTLILDEYEVGERMTEHKKGGSDVTDELTNEQFMSDARKRIRKALDQAGPYSHNIAGLVLSAVAERFGKQAANELIEEYALDDIYGIQQVPVDEVTNQEVINRG